MAETVGQVEEVMESVAEPRTFPGRRFIVSVAVLSLIWLSLFTMRLVGASDLMDNDQERPAAYVLDALRNGNWIFQRDQVGEISSKPPLYTWLAALSTMPFGAINRFSFYLPNALAVLLLSWTILAFGSRHFGHRAGFFGAAAYLLSTTTYKQVCLGRTDPLFGLLVMSGALCAYRAWRYQRSWTGFWLFTAAATLTKGPVGLVLAGGGMVGAVWERKACGPKSAKTGHIPGVILYLGITLGWFALAYLKMGQALVDKILLDELAGHAIRDGKGRLPLFGFYKPTFYFLARFFPWSVLSALGLWRVVSHPSPQTEVRCFERFLFCYFGVGVAVFSIAAHQRPDHLFPLLPAAALFAGKEIDRFLPSCRFSQAIGGVLAAWVLFFSLFTVYNEAVFARKRRPIQTEEVKALALAIRKKVGSEFPFVHTGSAFTLQFYLNTMRPAVSATQASRLLRGPEACFVATSDPEFVKANTQQEEPEIYQLARRPDEGPLVISVLSNHPRLEYTSRMATYVGPVRVSMEGNDLMGAKGNTLTFRAKASSGSLVLTNEGGSRQRLRVRVVNNWPEIDEEILLEPGLSWRAQTGIRRAR